MIIWRYGKMSETTDWTELDQWIGKENMKRDVPDAPAALREALEKFVSNDDVPEII